MFSLDQAIKAHVKKFGHDPLIIGLVERSSLAKAIARAIVMGIPYDEYELLESHVYDHG